MRTFLALATMLFLTHAVAAQQCVCTSGCRIASDPYPPTASQPTLCSVYKSGVFVNSANVVPSTNIAASNAAVCQPASAAYSPGPAGSVSCEVTIPAQPAGNVTITMRASNAAGETGDSTPYTFQSVSTLAVLPQVPVNLRPN